MELYKYIVTGHDKISLAAIKQVLCSRGHIFLGYSQEPQNILRHIRRTGPDVVIVEAYNNFHELRPMLEIIDEELLAACVLVIREETDEISEFLWKARNIGFITLPVKEESVMQLVDMSYLNFRRTLDYEEKVKKLNEALESRKIVERAKWVLVEDNRMSENEAYELIRKRSRDGRIPMREIAEAILMVKGISD